jgi:hypothetical protein
MSVMPCSLHPTGILVIIKDFAHKSAMSLCSLQWCYCFREKKTGMYLIFLCSIRYRNALVWLDRV